MRAVNTQLIETYWQVGQHIVEFEQNGKIRADYGKALITSLAKDLNLRHGKGFSRSNLIRIRQFYLIYPKGATLSHLLSWSHYVELLKIDDHWNVVSMSSRPCANTGQYGANPAKGQRIVSASCR